MLQKMSLSDLSKESREKWQTFALPSINDNALRFRVMDGTTAPWHEHEESDQLFFVIEGCLTVDTDDGSYSLDPNEFVIVPAGVRHRTKADGRATFVIFDTLSADQAEALKPA